MTTNELQDSDREEGEPLDLDVARGLLIEAARAYHARQVEYDAYVAAVERGQRTPDRAERDRLHVLLDIDQQELFDAVDDYEDALKAVGEE